MVTVTPHYSGSVYPNGVLLMEVSLCGYRYGYRSLFNPGRPLAKRLLLWAPNKSLLYVQWELIITNHRGH